MSNFPTSLDSYSDPGATSKLNSPSHSQQHIETNDALEKIEAKVGVNGSAVTSTHDYKLSGVTGTDKAASVAGAETLLNKTHTLPKINENVAVTTTSTQINYLKDSTGLTGTGKTVADTSPTLATPILNKPTVNASIQGESSLAPDAGATQNLDLDTVSLFHITMPAGNLTLTVSNEDPAQFFCVEIVNATSQGTLTWFSTIKWVGNTVPTLTGTNGKKDTFMFRVTSSDHYDGYIVGMNI